MLCEWFAVAADLEKSLERLPVPNEVGTRGLLFGLADGGVGEIVCRAVIERCEAKSLVEEIFDSGVAAALGKLEKFETCDAVDVPEFTKCFDAGREGDVCDGVDFECAENEMECDGLGSGYVLGDWAALESFPVDGVVVRA